MDYMWAQSTESSVHVGHHSAHRNNLAHEKQPVKARHYYTHPPLSMGGCLGTFIKFADFIKIM